MHVVVVGAGWSGLAAAVDLIGHGVDVTVIDAAKHVGGRARKITYRGQELDNGQHLMLGAYHATLNAMATVGVNESYVFARYPLDLMWLQRGSSSIIRLRAPKLPAPFHMISAIVAAQGLTVNERFSLIKCCVAAAAKGFRLETDLSVHDWLQQQQQPSSVIDKFWAPLCVAALTTPIHYASTDIFLRTLHDSFARKRRDSDLLLIRRSLDDVFPGPARCFIEKKGGRFILGERVTELQLKDSQIKGVKCASKIWRADHVVLALPYMQCHQLLESHDQFEAVNTQLSSLSSEPICTVYLQYPESCKLALPIIGLLGTTGQWLFDHGDFGRPGWIAVVISANGPHMKLSNSALSEHIVTELAEIFPAWPAPLSKMIVREKRATFSSQVGVKTVRPDCRTPVKGCWLAGDYTATDYPSTLEGAVRSGQSCAKSILSSFDPNV